MGYAYPVWDTLPALGTFEQSYSFDLTPIQISFGANLGTVVTLINGNLPAGLRYQVINNTINIYGAVTESTLEITGQFTFRLTQTNGSLADRTFSIILTPIPVAPSWVNQQTFLGYQTNVHIASYQLDATTTTGNHLNYSLFSPSIYTSVDQHTGILTCDANTIITNTTVTTVVQATDSVTGANSHLTIGIGIVVSAEPPIWITPAGTLGGTYYGNQFVEYVLQAEDPYSTYVTYELVSYSTGFPLKLPSPQPPAESGLLYGTLPDVLADTVYTFTVTATSINGTSTRNFDIIVKPAVLQANFYWVTDTNLGSINEGQYITIGITAISERAKTIVYNVTGGLLPPHLMLGTTNGLIVGFCEYTAVNKTYYFDVTAYDGYEYLTQQFAITVDKIYSNQFFNSYIPVTGSLRDVWEADSSNIYVREPGTVVFDTVTNILNPPTMNVINGLITGYSTPDQILAVITPWWHELNLQIGAASNTTVLSNGLSTVYRNIVDSQSGSNSIINSSYVSGGYVYPQSIDNIRNALISQYPYVTSGSGSGFVMLPNLNYSNGSIASVTVLDSGSNYLSPPTIVVGGAGSGGILQAVLGLVMVSVYSSTTGWQVGTTFAVPGNDAITPAILTVVQIDLLGQIVSVEITSAGSYKEVGLVNTIPIFNNASSVTVTLTWGVVAVDVVAGGSGYDCGITTNISGSEILPPWQSSYFPAIAVGELPLSTALLAANVLNYEPTTLWGTPWQPTVMIMQWQGLKWLGSTTFDNDTTTWDGNATRFQDTESPLETVFDDNTEIFDNGTTIFDYQDPLAYDLFQVWGTTLIDAGTTVFDLYSTIFDSLAPRTYSNTRLQKWINTQNRIYSGNNAVW
jgi:hypothetical protein